MKEPIPGVEGGEQLVCDGCGQHAGMPDPNSPTGTEVVTQIIMGPQLEGISLFSMGDWHQTCFQFALSGGFSYQTLLIKEERQRKSLSLHMPDVVGPGGLMKDHIEARTDDLMKQRERAIASSIVGPLLHFAIQVRDQNLWELGSDPSRLTRLESYLEELKARAGRAMVATATKFGMNAMAFDVLKECHAGKDGDCTAVMCPQTRDGEPMATGRHCPLAKDEEEE